MDPKIIGVIGLLFVFGTVASMLIEIANRRGYHAREAWLWTGVSFIAMTGGLLSSKWLELPNDLEIFSFVIFPSAWIAVGALVKGWVTGRDTPEPNDVAWWALEALLGMVVLMLIFLVIDQRWETGWSRETILTAAFGITLAVSWMSKYLPYRFIRGKYEEL